MKFKKILLLVAPILSLIACTGGGGEDGSDGGSGVLPVDPTQQTYAYVTNTETGAVWIYPIFTNGNIDFPAGKPTGNISFNQAHYVVVDATNTFAYVLDLGPAGQKNGTAYQCSINQSNGQLGGCTAITSGLADPYSMSLFGDNLYITRNTSNGYVIQCKITSKTCAPANNTVQSGFQPWGIATNAQGAFVTYTADGGNTFALYKYGIDINGNITGNGTKFQSTSTVSGPTQLAVNGDNLFISSTGSNSVSQFGISSLDVSGSPVSTIFLENYEISTNNNGNNSTFAYIANIHKSQIQGKIYNGYISRCPISGGLLSGGCISLQSAGVNQPYGIAITGVLKP
jgi:6-phosphogluconolactonase (cycloisomerase 2 family)